MGRRRLWLLFVAVVLTVGLTMIQTLREVQMAVEARDGKHFGNAGSARGQRNMLQRLPHQISLGLRGSATAGKVETDFVEHTFVEPHPAVEDPIPATSEAGADAAPTSTLQDDAAEPKRAHDSTSKADVSNNALSGEKEQPAGEGAYAEGDTVQGKQEITHKEQPDRAGEASLHLDHVIQEGGSTQEIDGVDSQQAGAAIAAETQPADTTTSQAGGSAATGANTATQDSLEPQQAQQGGELTAEQAADGSTTQPFMQPTLDAAATTTNLDAGSGRQCTMQRNQDSWGEVLVWGQEHQVDSAEACCAACAAYQPTPKNDMMECNVWVYCEDRELCGQEHGMCFLKHKPHPEENVAGRGPTVGWTTGVTLPEVAEEPVDPSEDRSYHVVVTAQGSPGMHWGSRVGYYWYKKVKGMCEREGNCQVGGFTRLLHDGQPDDLMDEIPTWVAQPLPPEHPDHGYVVLNRPYALLQWIEQATIPEKYVLMSEPDHLWLKPMPNLMKGQRPASFPFFYIEPWTKGNINITSKFLGPLTRAQAEKIAPIGNAPTLMSLEDMKRVMPVFFNMSIAIHNDPEANKEWGWVQEMYAFALSCYKLGIEVDLFRWMMSQPPYDSEVERFYILHYTYSNEFDKDGKMSLANPDESVWKFNKRAYYSLPPPRNLQEPPPNANNDMVRHLIRAINEASTVIPDWEQYAATGRAEKVWDGVVG